ncbi:MAG: DUF4188 domain-containing protein [Terracidiphilus sp.]|jgi:hypothetical protein
MAPIFPGRYTALSDEPFVVFLIGFRVNRWLSLRSWTRMAAAMPRMIAELRRNPELGLMHAQYFVYWRGAGVMQYWRSFELLHAYAHARDAQHLPAWAEFNRLVSSTGAVGIWHETYKVTPGQYESIYTNMPQFGLGSAAKHVPVTGRLEDARSRMERPAERQAKPDQNL